MLQKFAADAVIYPVIATEVLGDEYFKAAFKMCMQSGLIAFTSPFGAQSFLEWCIGFDGGFKKIMPQLNTACVGGASASVLSKYGINTIYPKVPNAENMAVLIEKQNPGSVAVICAQKHSDQPWEYLEKAGIECRAAPVYRTCVLKNDLCAESVLQFSEREYVLFASGSAVHAFYKNCKYPYATFKKIKALCTGKSALDTALLYGANAVLYDGSDIL